MLIMITTVRSVDLIFELSLHANYSHGHKYSLQLEQALFSVRYAFGGINVDDRYLKM
jgi:hypothetical protein